MMSILKVNIKKDACLQSRDLIRDLAARVGARLRGCHCARAERSLTCLTQEAGLRERH
jgi:hypothetical protein